MNMRRAILTGATGAIGLALIRELISDGVEVLVLCHKGSKRIDRIPVSPLVELKDCSLDDLAGLTNDTGKEYDVFYHFAWAGTTGDARNDMPLQNQNVRYALDAVECAARFGCKRFVGAGSQAEYGRVEGTLKPDTPAFPENGYGMAKLCAGQMTRIRAHQLGMEHVWPRILSVYGPYDGEASMVTSTIRKLLEGVKPSFTKGEQQWDYLYSCDAGKAFKLIGERGRDGAVYPLGSGKARPLADYILMMRDAANPDAELGLGDIPYGNKQVMYLCADITDLTRDTGWVPETDFETGIANTVAWLRG